MPITFLVIFAYYKGGKCLLRNSYSFIKLSYFFT